MTRVLVLCILFVAATSAQKVDYTGHKVLRVIPETNEQLQLLFNWISINDHLDVWLQSFHTNEPTDILVSTESYAQTTRSLAEINLTYKVQIEDLGKRQSQEEEMIASRQSHNRNSKIYDLENYHTYEEVLQKLEVMTYLQDLADSSPLVSTTVGGTTDEGRDIVMLTISSGGNSNKSVIFFECTIHAREWISVATCSWIIDQLVSQYGTNTEITTLVDQYDWKFVPISNPDGYAHTWSSDRMWRKNRAVIEGSSCQGVDINRNFPPAFGGTGSSADPCSETYYGTAAFSEKESRALRDLITADRGRVKAALAIHSYAQYWMSPYSYTNTIPADYFEMMRVMGIGVNAIVSTGFGTSYRYGTSAQVNYIASGCSSDYYYDTEKVTHTYTLELRDMGQFGFLLPQNQIRPTATETWNGIKAFIKAI